MIFWLCFLMTASWLGLALFWHGFWRADQRLRLLPQELSDPPSVTAIVPARNEEDTVATIVGNLQAQDYSGTFFIVVANDNSTDRTDEILAELQEPDQLSIVDTGALPQGWAGKMWALHNGIAQAETSKPDYYWLTDADIAHQPGVLASLVAHAETQQLALVSQMVRLRCHTFWEKLLVPAFIFYFTLIYPFRAVNNPASSIAGAAGGSILIRRDALEGIGGITALKDAVIDDCTLAQLIKKSGRKIWLGLGERSLSLRGYEKLSDFWQMVQRSAYTQLQFSPFLLAVAICGILFSHILPVMLWCWPAMAVMTFIYWPTVRYYGLSPLWSVTLPVAAVFFGAMTISSALAHHLGWSNKWRNREVGKR